MVKFSENKKQYYREYYHNNKEKYRAWVNKYQQSEKGQKRRKKYEKEYNQRPDVIKRRREYGRIRRSSRSHQLKCLFLIQMRRVLERYNENGRTGLKNITIFIYKDMYGMDIEAVLNKLKPLPKNLKDYEIDHIIPQSKFDFTKKKDRKKAWHPNNIRLISRKENRKKGNRPL